MKALLLLTSLFLSTIGWAQLETVVTSPFWMVSMNFLGPNYEVSNVQYLGAQNTFGQFDASNTTMGLDKGIILNTGTIITTSPNEGPHGPNDHSASGIDNYWQGNNLLTDLIGGTPTFNAATLEFDFIPSVDSIYMKYVFGSDEYPEYVDSPFNDVFAIFISGPGIVDQEVITTLPIGGIVSINTVNAGSNSFYFQDNGNGSNAPWEDSNIYIQYDGFTKNTVAFKNGLSIGETYHLVIAIADGGDGNIDSGLFIESCEGCLYNVGIENQELAALKLYPNPAHGVLNIESPIETGTLQVFSSNGQLMSTHELTTLKSSIDISELNKGIYFVTLQSGDQLIRSKIVVD